MLLFSQRHSLHVNVQKRFKRRGTTTTTLRLSGLTWMNLTWVHGAILDQNGYYRKYIEYICSFALFNLWDFLDVIVNGKLINM